MKTILSHIVLMIIVISCSSAPEKNVATKSAITNGKANSTVSKPKPITFTKDSDYYELKQTKNTHVMADESIGNLSTKELNLVPEGADPLSYMVKSCYLKAFDKALMIADQYFQQYEKHPTYWNQLGTCYFLMGNDRKALLYYNKALEVVPGYTPTLNNFGVIYRKNKEDQKAAVAFDRAMKGAPLAKTPRFNIAQLYLSYGLVDMALPIFQGMYNETPTDVDVLSGLANSYFLIGDYANALVYFRKIPTEQVARADIGLNFTMSLHYTGENKIAQKVFGEIETDNLGPLASYYKEVQGKIGE